MGNSSRTARALALRDMALSILREHGTWTKIGPLHMLTCKVGGVVIAHRTPFQQLPQPSGETIRKAVLYGRMPTENLPYGLDLWNSGKKLNIEWADDGRVVVASYKAGDWEREVENLSAGPARVATCG